MDNLIWYIIMIPCSALFTVLGVYAWNRKKPMWFWAGSEVKETEISDIPAYKRANGIMWLVYSLIFWAATFAMLFSKTASLVLIIVGCVVSLPLLFVIYKRIYTKYKA